MDLLTALRISYQTRQDALPKRAERHAWVQGRMKEMKARRALPRRMPAGLRGPGAAIAAGIGAVGYGISRMREKQGRKPGVMASRLATHRHQQARERDDYDDAFEETDDYNPNQPRNRSGQFGRGEAKRREIRAVRQSQQAKRVRQTGQKLSPGGRGALIGGIIGGPLGAGIPGGAIGAGIGGAIGTAFGKREVKAKHRAITRETRAKVKGIRARYKRGRDDLGEAARGAGAAAAGGFLGYRAGQSRARALADRRVTLRQAPGPARAGLPPRAQRLANMAPGRFARAARAIPGVGGAIGAAAGLGMAALSRRGRGER